MEFVAIPMFTVYSVTVLFNIQKEFVAITEDSYQKGCFRLSRFGILYSVL